MSSTIIPFVQQTANDYDIKYGIVKMYYDMHGSTPQFYEKLESYLIEMADQKHISNTI